MDTEHGGRVSADMDDSVLKGEVEVEGHGMTPKPDARKAAFFNSTGDMLVLSEEAA